MTTSELMYNTICPKCFQTAPGLTSQGVCYRCKIDKIAEIPVPEKYKKMTFETYKTAKQENVKLLTIAKDFLTNKKGLFLSGVCGTGKTHLAVACYISLKLSGKSVKFISVPELLLEIRETFNNNGETERELIERYSEYEFLFLDDLGVEKQSHFSSESLYLLLDRRDRQAKEKIFITSNLSLQEISERLSDRIASRIAGLCEVVNIRLTHDWRVRKQTYIEASQPPDNL